MALLDVLGEQWVRVGVAGEDKEEVLEELVDALVRANQVTDREAALAALLERERLGTTGIGGGVAIPHGKHESVTTLTAALGTSPNGIEWEAADGEPVYLVFLVLAEANNPGPHVQLLADIARLLKTPGLRQRLVAADSPDGVMRLIGEVS